MDHKPFAWVRFRSDGGVEGPILDSSKDMCDVRRKSGAWTPLFIGTPEVEAAPEILAALEAEQEWQDRFHAGAIDPEWDYEEMVGSKRRNAIAAVRAA